MRARRAGPRLPCDWQLRSPSVRGRRTRRAHAAAVRALGRLRTRSIARQRQMRISSVTMSFRDSRCLMRQLIVYAARHCRHLRQAMIARVALRPHRAPCALRRLDRMTLAWQPLFSGELAADMLAIVDVIADATQAPSACPANISRELAPVW